MDGKRFNIPGLPRQETPRREPQGWTGSALGQFRCGCASASRFMTIFLRAAEACGLLTPPFRPFRRTKFSKEGIVRAGTSPLRLLGTLQTNPSTAHVTAAIARTPDRSAPRRRCNNSARRQMRTRPLPMPWFSLRFICLISWTCRTRDTKRSGSSK